MALLIRGGCENARVAASDAWIARYADHLLNLEIAA
jgi:hypothetical protein